MQRHVQTLETRTMRTVTVEDLGLGVYEVQGDGFGNYIHIALDHNYHTLKVNADLYSNASSVFVYGNGGNDSIDVTSVRPTDPPYIGISVNGGPADDVLTIGPGNGGGLFGDDGADYLGATDSFRIQMYGGTGNDHIVLNGLSADADVRGEDGDDTIDAQACTAPVALYGGKGTDRLYGSPLGDILDGGEGQDYLFGREGDDMIYARDGEFDYISGGGGRDTAEVDKTATGAPVEATIGGVEVLT